MKALLYLLLLSLSIVAVSWFTSQRFQDWSNTKHSITGEAIVDLQAGARLNTLSRDLKVKGVVDYDWLFRFWVKYYADYSKFQAGKYRFTGEITPREVVASFSTGDTYNPVVFELTIPEGYTFKQVAEKLVGSGIGTLEELLSLRTDKALIKSLKVPSSSLEGYLYPATYSFAELPNARDVISLTVGEFWKRIPMDYEQRLSTMGLSLNQGIIFASLIELETADLDEKPLVSEVIWRRLKDGGSLGIDASIIYGIDNFDGNLTRKQLDDTSNLYNSRIYPGLPPTAIGSPDVSSLLAVLNPSNKGYYYYVVDPSQGSRHHFSKTLSEHNSYVRALISYSRKNSTQGKRK